MIAVARCFTDPSRSHFDAQDSMESGTPGKTTSDGLLNRALPAAGEAGSVLRAVALGNQVPRCLRGGHEAIAVWTLVGCALEVGAPQ